MISSEKVHSVCVLEIKAEPEKRLEGKLPAIQIVFKSIIKMSYLHLPVRFVSQRSPRGQRQGAMIQLTFPAIPLAAT